MVTSVGSTLHFSDSTAVILQITGTVTIFVHIFGFFLLLGLYFACFMDFTIIN